MAIKNKQLEPFRQHYRSADFLLIDDIQFLAGKKSTSSEFFHTFNDLHHSGSQIVVTSDRPVSEIANLQEQIISRLKGGLVVEIREPNAQTRKQIIAQKAGAEGIHFNQTIIERLAQIPAGNVRVIEGIITKIKAYTQVAHLPITHQLIEQLIHPFMQEQKTTNKMEKITQYVSRYFQINEQEVLSTRKVRHALFPRYSAIYLCTQMTKQSIQEIGEYFNGRSQAAITAALKKAKELLQTNEDFRKHLQTLEVGLQKAA